MATTAVQSTLWIRRLLSCLGLQTSPPTAVYVYNQAALSVAKNTAPTRKRKFIQLRYHFLRNAITNRHINLHHVSNFNILADILSKPLSKPRFIDLRTALNILHPFSAAPAALDHRDRGTVSALSLLAATKPQPACVSSVLLGCTAVYFTAQSAAGA